MSVASIAQFFHGVTAVGLTVFGQRLTQSDWQILFALARGPSPGVSLPDAEVVPAGSQSYKTLKFICGLSDDALSRGLRRLGALGLVDRHETDADQRVIRYTLSTRAEQGLTQMGRIVVAEFGALILSFSMEIGEAAEEPTQTRCRG